jgi:hypothetical protein
MHLLSSLSCPALGSTLAGLIASKCLSESSAGDTVFIVNTHTDTQGRIPMASIRIYARDFYIRFLGNPSWGSNLVATNYAFEPFGECTYDNGESEKRGLGPIVEARPKYTIDVEVPGGFQQFTGASLVSLKDPVTDEVKVTDIFDLMKKVHEHADGYHVRKTQYEPETGL